MIEEVLKRLREQLASLRSQIHHAFAQVASS
jgi:hypothetical protein